MKKKRLISLIAAFSLVFTGVTAYVPSGVYAEENVQMENLVQGKAAIASSTANGYGPEYAVDGVTSEAVQWNSADMKNWGAASGSSKDSEEQTAQWIQIDRGEDAEEEDISSIRLWYNMKVWPMEYELYTADESTLTAGSTDVDLNNWTSLVSVSRPSANGLVANGEGQNIADTSANTDTITTTSSPALAVDAKLKRYVLMYIRKVNAQAVGNNVNLREIQVFSQNESADVNGTLSGITADSLQIEDGQITVNTGTARGVNAYVRGSSLENVVSNDGQISDYNIGDRNVTLLVRVENKKNPEEYAEKNIEVTIQDHSGNYPDGNFPEVSAPNEKPEVIPSLQEWYGYEGDFELTESSKIIYNDTADVGIREAAWNMQEDLKEISGLDLTVEEGNAPSSSNDIYIESQTDDTYGVGDEGYLLKTDDEGVHICASTYTGCLYGTITVEQILDQAEDNRTVPKGITRDYPAYEVRGIMLDVARTSYRLSQLQDYARVMLWYKMNEYHLHINDNDNCNTAFASNETHAGFHRLESDEFPSLTSEVKHAGIPSNFVNEDYYLNNADYQGNPTYTKEEWKELQQTCSGLGIHMMTEIDLPGHSLLYNKYADENPDGIDWLQGGIRSTSTNVTTKGGLELLDLQGANAERALRFAKTLWNEYTEGNSPTISGDVVHIGADEYWDHTPKDQFAQFADQLRQTIQGNLGSDTKIRMWGAGTGMFSTASTVLSDVDLTSNYQLDIWATNYENAKARAAEGYGIVNCRDAYLYGNPGRTNRDVPNAEYLFNDWNPTIFGANNVLLGEPNLLGAKAAIWGDQSQEGMTEKDVHQRVLRATAIVSEKTWGGTDDSDTFEQYEMRAAKLAEGPGTDIAMQVDSDSSLVLDYDFKNVSSDGKTVYDTSGNGYNGTLGNGAEISEDGYLSFDGTALTTPLKTLSYPYTVAFDLKVDSEEAAKNTTASSLFSGYDGQIQIAGTESGHLSANVNYFTRDFNYTVPTDDSTVKIMLVGTFQGTKLYVNGQLQTFLSQKSDADGLASGAITTLNSSVLLPLEKIGENLHGKMANLQVYNQALSAEEAAEYYTDDWGETTVKTNVAQNKAAGGTSYKSGDAVDNAERRINVAFKAFDGDAFTEKEDTTAKPDTSTSEMNSFWKGYHADSSLCVDLGETRSVSEVEIQWRYGGKGKDFNILVSDDGENWTTAKKVRGNGDFFNTVSLDEPTEARYVKMQGIASNASAGIYMIQEFKVYETVDKTQLNTLLKQAEELIKKDGLNFESTDSSESSLVKAAVYASSLKNNQLATLEETENARAELAAALQNYSTKPEPEKSYSVTVVQPKNGSLTVSENEAKEGDKITIIVSADDGYKLKGVKAVMEDDSVVELTEEADHSYSFVMPAGAVSVSAKFEKNDAGTDNPDQPSKPDQPSISDKPSNGDQGSGNKDASVSEKDDTAVKTGDPLNAERPVLLFVISAMLLLAAWKLKKHKDNI